MDLFSRSFFLSSNLYAKITHYGDLDSRALESSVPKSKINSKIESKIESHAIDFDNPKTWNLDSIFMRLTSKGEEYFYKTLAQTSTKNTNLLHSLLHHSFYGFALFLFVFRTRFCALAIKLNTFKA
ncbi:hypothetical protein [Helicobacter fennelliae]|uniref:hypothetical protein n=1 Tax=Helicobacter fennelliae TaxID=215 RepID=UPI000DD2FDC0|nr:hypothetical protein [Helicobacter fennelliae]